MMNIIKKLILALFLILIVPILALAYWNTPGVPFGASATPGYGTITASCYGISGSNNRLRWVEKGIEYNNLSYPMGFTDTQPYPSGTQSVTIQFDNGVWNPPWETQWATSVNVPYMTIYFDKQGGEGGNDSVSASWSQAYQSITPPSREGYTFHGYYDSPNGVGTKYFEDNGSADTWNKYGSQSYTLYAYWTANCYTVTLDENEATVNGTSSVTVVYNQNMPSIIVPSRTGYTFDGYWTTKDGDGTQYYDKNGNSARTWNLADDTTLYARWSLDKYSIKYYDGGVEIDDNSATKISDIEKMTEFSYEDAVTLPVDVIKENAIFNGWYESVNLVGSAIFSWPVHTLSRLQNQNFYAKWIEIAGTRADSEKQSFLATIFGNTASEPTYSTANVRVYLDGTITNVNQVQLNQGATTYTMAGVNGVYSYTTSDNASGTWNILVNGADSGVDLTFGTPAQVNMLTVKVAVKSDDVSESNRNVILKTDDSNLTLSESDTNGVYTLQTFVEDKTYNIYIDGESIGCTLNTKNIESSQCLVNYYTAVVNVKKDDDFANIGAVELKNGNTVLTLTGTDGNYSLNRLEDDLTSYDVYVDGKDTGFDISFTSNNRNKTVDYYTVIVNTKQNDDLANISDVTLRDNNDVIMYTLTSSKAGIYSYVLQENDTEYKIFVGDDDTGKTASFTSSGRKPEAIDYYTAKIITKKDGSESNIGTVELKTGGSSTLTLFSTGTGVYELTKIKDIDTVYDVYIGGESVDETLKFTSLEHSCVVDYTSLLLTTNLDGTAQNMGSVVLKANGIPNLTMTYDADSKKYKAVTCFDDNRDVYVNDSDTNVNLEVGNSCTLDYYTLSYNLDGGSGTMPTDTIYIGGTEINLPEEIPTKEDNQFTGWQDTASPIPNVFSMKNDGTFDSITIGATTHTLTALWTANSSYEAKYKIIGSDEWTYSTAQYALEFAQNHLNSNYNVEIQKNAVVSNGTLVASNTNLLIPNGMTLFGNITNNGIINLNGTISGTVTNAGTIDGGGTIGADDVLTLAGTINNLVNQDEGNVYNCNVSVANNLGILTDCRIVSGTNVNGTVNGTIFVESGVTFASSLNVLDNTGNKAVISLIGGGTITSSININTATNFAGLMLNNGSHYSVQANVHLRNKLTVTDNQLYADFFDFNAPSILVYNNQEHTASFSNSRTTGIGEIKKIYYRMKTGESTWSSWTEVAPVETGIYQVKIDVADGEYYIGKNDVIDEEVWTFIIKKPVVVLWKTNAKEYTGNQLNPDVELVGIESIHEGNVALVLDNGERKKAGTYQVIASLEGEASNLYEITNPYSEFIINKAPVTFTVTNNTKLTDGLGKQALVSASPNVGFTVYYYDSDGVIVNGLPSEVGDYNICVELEDNVKQNYRVVGSADGKVQKIGTLTLYSGNVPKDYKLSFEPGDGATGNKNDMEAVKAKTIRMLPDGTGFTKSDYVFLGWKYNKKIYYAGEYFEQPESDVTLVAQWTKKVYDIGGIASTSDNVPLENAIVILMSGARQVNQMVTGLDGKFSFSNVVAGKYNLVINYNGITVTTAIEITDKSVENFSLKLPSGRTNSVVEVKPGTPEIIVDGLEKSFVKTVDGEYNQEDEDVVINGGSVEFKLEVEQNSSPDLTTQQCEELKNAIDNVGIYLDLELIKTVRDNKGIKIEEQSKPIYTSDKLLAIEIPIDSDFQNMDNYGVFRYHSPDGTVANERFEQLEQVIESDNPTREGFCVSNDKRSIIVYTKNFSLYVISYGERSSSGSVIRRVNDTNYTININDTLHGFVSVDRSIVSQGQNVTISVKPDEGYILETIIVKDISGNEIKLNAKALGEVYTFDAPSANVTIFVTFAESECNFVDVKPGDYFYDAVLWAVENNITNGMDETHFGPMNITTRAHMVTFMWKASGSPEPKSMVSMFDDVVKGSYYEKAVAWGYENGYVKGIEEKKFDPKANVTRGQVVTFLSRMSDEANNLSRYSHNFVDVNKSDYYNDSVAWAVARKITSGTDSTHFSPKNECKRAELITFLYRFFSKN